MIAALYVDGAGPYAELDGIDAWPIERDARLYPGPWPVVAHPPCNVWCQLASVNAARWGTPVGDDSGLFAHALDMVRTYGGVLEHPAYSLAWSRHGLPRPTRGYWSASLDDPGMVTEVSQSAYGHLARKRTWLYAVGIDPTPLLWADDPGAGVIGAGVNSGECVGRLKLRDATARNTPPAFVAELVALARTARAPIPAGGTDVRS